MTLAELILSAREDTAGRGFLGDAGTRARGGPLIAVPSELLLPTDTTLTKGTAFVRKNHAKMQAAQVLVMQMRQRWLPTLSNGRQSFTLLG